MDWLESIREIQKAQENDRLVIFVGAGVSMNSRIPSCSKLVREFADKLGYSRCRNCELRTEICSTQDCAQKYNFTQDEFLRIPEYYYNQDKSDNHTNYYDLIKNILKPDDPLNTIEPNAINEEIFNLLPRHIITTNYDELLENVKNPNHSFYTVISKDSDLLSRANDRYIIKMHGTINEPETIVLKESDYIDFEQNHPLISTFIRSLLVNHVFLFIGYSLNDYNLNLIICWINYFSKKHGRSERPINILLTSSISSNHEYSRLQSKNIFPINVYAIPHEIIKKIGNIQNIDNDIGKMFYSYLKCISDSTIAKKVFSLEQIAKQNYFLLNPYNKISYQDFISVFKPKNPIFFGENIILNLDDYRSFSNLLANNSLYFIGILQRVGIKTIICEKEPKVSIPSAQKSSDECFVKSLNNEYIQILSIISKKLTLHVICTTLVFYIAPKMKQILSLAKISQSLQKTILFQI